MITKCNEVYTDLEQSKKNETSQLEMWIHVLQVVKMGLINGNVPIKELSSRYKITKK